MSFLLRVMLPDTPGSLSQLTEALGIVDANIQSVDVVQVLPDGTAMDDIVVTLPAGTLPDTLISAAQQVPDVHVDSIRPFSGTVDRRGQVRMLAEFAEHRNNEVQALQALADVLPRIMTSGWCVVMRNHADRAERVAASAAAPTDDGSTPHVPIDSARILNPEKEAWIPDGWALLDSALVGAPVGETGLVLAVGRPGGPNYLASEVSHLGDVATVMGGILGVTG